MSIYYLGNTTVPFSIVFVYDFDWYISDNEHSDTDYFGLFLTFFWSIAIDQNHSSGNIKNSQN